MDITLETTLTVEELVSKIFVETSVDQFKEFIHEFFMSMDPHALGRSIKKSYDETDALEVINGITTNDQKTT